MSEILFKHAAPVLCVRELDPAIDFYARLGFVLLSRFESYALLNWAGVCLHLRVPSAVEAITPEANPCGAYFYLEGVDAFAVLVRERDVQLLGEPADQPYGVRECAISDPDGNLLRFGEVLGRDALLLP